MNRAQERCVCLHHGHAHSGMIMAGACTVEGCDCARFTWDATDEHNNDLLAHSHRAELERDERQFREYGSPADEIRQALTVIALETDSLSCSDFVDGDGIGAIKASIERIKGALNRGVVWEVPASEYDNEDREGCDDK